MKNSFQGMKHFRSANQKKNTFQDMKHFATSHCLKFAATSQRFAEKWLKRYYLRGCPFAFSCQRTTCISCLLPCYLNKRSNNDKCSKVRNLFQSFTMSARCSTVLKPKDFRLLFGTIIVENSPFTPFPSYQIVKFDLAPDCRHQQDGPYTDDDF